MKVAILLWAAALAPPSFVETRIDLGGPLITYETPDVNDDGQGDVTAVVRERGQRVMVIYLSDRSGGFQASPSWRWTLPPEVVAYGLHDYRPEPGLELLLLSRRGLYSISPADAKVRGNLRTELKAPLFPELSDPESLPRWDWFVDVDGDRDVDVVLPVQGALVAYSKTADGLQARMTFPLQEDIDLPSRNLRFRIGEGRLGGRASPLPSLFPGQPSSFPVLDDDRMLDHSREYHAPRILDWDGDGRVDLVYQGGSRLGVRRQQSPGVFADETDWLTTGSAEELMLEDLGGDGRLQVVRVEEDGDGLSKDYTVTVFGRDGELRVAETATVALRFSASDAEFSFVDVDSDGRLDLVARLIDLPSTLGALGDLTVDSTLLVHLGRRDGTLSSKPDARFKRELKPEDLSRLLELLVTNLEGDYDGDGLNDLLTIRPDGLMEIRPLERAGDGIRFAAEPSSVYLPKLPVRDARPAWITRDGASDLVLRHEEALTVFVSRGGAR